MDRLVADTNADGVPDWLYGTDNPTDSAGGDSPRHWWRTDLHSGRSEFYLGDRGRYWLPSGTVFYGEPGGALFFGMDTPGGRLGGRPKRYYAWAAMIEDGQIVATDYAPDAGWLVPNPKS